MIPIKVEESFAFNHFSDLTKVSAVVQLDQVIATQNKKETKEEAEAEAEVETKAEAEIEVEVKAESEVEAELEAKAKVEAEANVDTEAQIEGEAQKNEEPTEAVACDKEVDGDTAIIDAYFDVEVNSTKAVRQDEIQAQNIIVYDDLVSEAEVSKI